MSNDNWVPMGDSSIYGWQGNLWVEPPQTNLSLAVSIPMNTKWITNESSEDK